MFMSHTMDKFQPLCEPNILTRETITPLRWKVTIFLSFLVSFASFGLSAWESTKIQNYGTINTGPQGPMGPPGISGLPGPIYSHGLSFLGLPNNQTSGLVPGGVIKLEYAENKSTPSFFNRITWDNTNNIGTLTCDSTQNSACIFSLRAMVGIFPNDALLSYQWYDITLAGMKPLSLGFQGFSGNTNPMEAEATIKVFSGYQKRVQLLIIFYNSSSYQGLDSSSRAIITEM